MAYIFPLNLKHKHSSTSIVSTSSCPLLPGNDVVIMSREKESSEKADTLPTEDDRLVPSLNCLVQFHLRHLDKEGGFRKVVTTEKPHTFLLTSLI